jgi:hypothetical protein
MDFALRPLTSDLYLRSPTFSMESPAIASHWKARPVLASVTGRSAQVRGNGRTALRVTGLLSSVFRPLTSDLRTPPPSVSA